MTLVITNNQNTKDMVCKYINIKECVIENIELIDNEKIKPEQKNIILKISNYNMKSIKISVFIYYGRKLKEVRTYIGNYKNDIWKLELRDLSYSDY